MLAALPTILSSVRGQWKNLAQHEDPDLNIPEAQSSRHLEITPVLADHVETVVSEQNLEIDTDNGEASEEKLTQQLGWVSTRQIALVFCIPWFVATYLSKACLQYTTVASVTLLLSTISIWTLIFGTLTGVERFSWKRLCGVLGSFVGVLLVLDFNFASRKSSLKDVSIRTRVMDKFPKKTASELALGNTFTLLSAIIFGLYTVLLKKTTTKIQPQQLNVLLFFGLIGMCNMVLLLPCFPALHYSGIEKFSLPQDARTWSALLLNSIFSVMSDICWLYAMVMTSPLVVSVGLSLAIPLSLVGEMVLQGHYEGWLYWFGSGIVFASFVFVDQEGVQDMDGTADD